MSVDNTIHITPVYSPASLVSIFSKAFILPEERKIIQVKGVFQKSGTVPYGDHYYDKLKDEASDHTLTIITSSLVHNDLKDNTTIQFNGFVTRKIDKYGRIEFQVNFIDLMHTSANKYSEEDAKKIEIINAKLKSGIKDLDSLIKHHAYNNSKMKIAVIIGKSAIIDSDITTALGASVAHYDLYFHRVSIASIKEISDAIIKFDNSDVELICVARGGGEQMEALNKSELAEYILDRKKIIASAIGHADDVSLFEKISDKRFTTPTAFGTYLKQIYDETIEDLSKSKAKMQKDITTSLTKIYDEQLKIINGKLESTIKLYTQEKKTILESHENLKKQLIELNDKKIKDLNEAALKSKAELIELNEKKVKDLNESAAKLKAENDRLATQLIEARKIPTTNYAPIIILIIIVIILFIIFSKK